MIFHRDMPHVYPGTRIGGNVPLRAFAVELDEIDCHTGSLPTASAKAICRVVPSAHSRETEWSEFLRAGFRSHAAGRCADRCDEVAGPCCCTVRGKDRLQKLVRLVAVDAGGREAAARRQREEAEIRPDIEHGSDRAGNAGEAVAVEEDKVDELKSLHSFFAFRKTDWNGASSDVDRTDVDLAPRQVEYAVARHLKPPLDRLNCTRKHS